MIVDIYSCFMVGNFNFSSFTNFQMKVLKPTLPITLCPFFMKKVQRKAKTLLRISYCSRFYTLLAWPLLCQTSKATNESRPHIWFSWVKRRFIDACRKQLDHGEFHQVRCWKFVATRVTKTDVGLSHVRWTRTIRNRFRGWSCGGYGGKNTGRGTPALWRHSSVRRAWRLQVG